MPGTSVCFVAGWTRARWESWTSPMFELAPSSAHVFMGPPPASGPNWACLGAVHACIHHRRCDRCGRLQLAARWATCCGRCGANQAGARLLPLLLLLLPPLPAAVSCKMPCIGGWTWAAPSSLLLGKAAGATSAAGLTQCSLIHSMHCPHAHPAPVLVTPGVGRVVFLCPHGP
jgi:hypothetical protein